MRATLMYYFERESKSERMGRQLIDIAETGSFRFAERIATD
jgi:hypothetical protein